MSSKAERRAAARQAADGGVAVDTAAGGPAPLPSPPRPPPASKKDVPCRKGSACEDARCAFKHPAPAPPVVAAAAAVVTPRCPVTEFPQLAPALGAARGAPHAAVAAAAAAAARGGVAARAEALLRSLLEFVEGFEPTAAGPPAAEALVGALGEQLAGAARAAAAARRPLPPPFAAAFGWLKAAALRLPRDAPLDAAKRGVRAEVEAFIAGGVRCAGELARCAAGARGGLLRAALAPGRRVAVLGRSAAVEALLVEAHARLAPGGGDSFSVLLLPGAVAGEGEAAAARLASAGVRVALCAGTAVDEALSGADALLLGAAAVLGDGSLLARAGAAAACLRAAAAEPPVPVVVAAESFKFVELLLPPGDGSAVAEVRLREGAPPAPAPAAKAPPAEPASEELLRVPWSGGGGGGDARAPRAAPHELCVFLDCVPAALVSGYVTELAPALLSPGDAALVVAAVEERWPGWGAGGGEGAGGGGGARAALSAHLQACGGAEEALVAALFAAAPMRRAAAAAPEDTCKRDAAAAAAAPGAADAAAWPAWRAAKAPLLEKFSALATRLARRQAGDSDAAVVGFFAKGLCELLAALPERGHGVTVGCALNECARLAAPVLDAAPALLALPAICARFFALLKRAKPGREVADVHLQPLSAELAKALGKLLEEELLVDFEDVAKGSLAPTSPPSPPSLPSPPLTRTQHRLVLSPC
jgi:translation initiation factor 2B subunit (eIF-2B alpha/beta/delta family)